MMMMMMVFPICARRHVNLLCNVCTSQFVQLISILQPSATSNEDDDNNNEDDDDDDHGEDGYDDDEHDNGDRDEEEDDSLPSR